MRPKIKRHICKSNCAKFRLFKPNGIPASELEKIELAEDEFEAMRLVDLELLAQQDAALQMQVSRQTFANILKSARQKVSNALVNGHALVLGKKE
ncbi:DUF134 domain-containing protein [Psychromonas hadalis]|uniref:DUF134 domain-containing protein n=1 Tax=Psychromonas hadalis TaxID=211669 RepID=UPI0003B6FE90|nr:DUF134 domain-containing protein [Psychromonas hadalis]